MTLWDPLCYIILQFVISKLIDVKLLVLRFGKKNVYLHNLNWQLIFFEIQGVKNFTRTAANLLAAMTKIDNNYYPEVSDSFWWYFISVAVIVCNCLCNEFRHYIECTLSMLVLALRKCFGLLHRNFLMLRRLQRYRLIITFLFQFLVLCSLESIFGYLECYCVKAAHFILAGPGTQIPVQASWSHWLKVCLAYCLFECWLIVLVIYLIPYFPFQSVAWFPGWIMYVLCWGRLS